MCYENTSFAAGCTHVQLSVRMSILKAGVSGGAGVMVHLPGYRAKLAR